MKKPSTTVSRWQCGECTSLHDSTADADACCLCPCGRVIARIDQRKYGAKKCARCTLKENIRFNQEALRRHERSLSETKRNLERLQAEKRAFDQRERGVEPRLAAPDGVPDPDDGLA